MKGMGMLVVSLSGVNFGFWSHVGCSGENAIIFSRERLVYGCTRKNIKMYIYCLCFNMVSFRGQKSFSHTHIGLLQGFNSKFPTSILTPFICRGAPPPPNGRQYLRKRTSDKSIFWKGVLLHAILSFEFHDVTESCSYTLSGVVRTASSGRSQEI